METLNIQMKRRTISKAITDIIEAIGDNPLREGLRETPYRVAKAYERLFGGYEQDPNDVLSAVFEDGACDEMIVLKDIEFYSTCEHHLLPFYGHVDFAYIPNKKVVGVSKIARLIEVFSRRLQIQERMTAQIADAFENALQPLGVMVVVEATHLCMVARGVEKQHSKMVTSAIRGVFQEQEPRTEFMSLRGKK